MYARQYRPLRLAAMRPVAAAAAAAAVHRLSPGREVETSVCRTLWDTCASRGRGVVAVPSRRPPRPACRSRRRAAAAARRSADSRRRSLPTSTAGSPAHVTWRHGVVATTFRVSTHLLYVGPGYHRDGWPSSAHKPRRYATSHPGQLSLLPHAGQEMNTGQSAVTLCGWGVERSWLIRYVDERVGGMYNCVIPR